MVFCPPPHLYGWKACYSPAEGITTTGNTEGVIGNSGGVAILVHKSVCIGDSHLELDGRGFALGVTWNTPKWMKKPALLGLYAPPGKYGKAVLERCADIYLPKVRQHGNMVVLAGDLNIQLGHMTDLDGTCSDRKLDSKMDFYDRDSEGRERALMGQTGLEMHIENAKCARLNDHNHGRSARLFSHE